MSARAAAAALLAIGTWGAPAHAADDCAPGDWSAMAGWSGVWRVATLEVGINGRDIAGAPAIFSEMKLIGVGAPWNDEGWRRLEKAVAPGATGLAKNRGWGFPMMMSAPAPFVFVVSPWATTIVNQYRDIRQIYTDGREHPPEEDRWPNEWGDSIGCWSGDTFTIDTTDVKYNPALNFFNAPVSEEARFVERMRLVGPGRIESEITVTDPITLEEPWHVTMIYARMDSVDRLVLDGDMVGNDRTRIEGDTLTIAPPRVDDTAEPVEDMPDRQLTEAELERVVGRYQFDGAPLVLRVERRGQRLLFSVDGAQPFALPLHPKDSLSFRSLSPKVGFTFVPDGAGRITRFTGTAPDGRKVSGARIVDP